MNINSTNSYTPNFQASIKMTKPTQKELADKIGKFAIGTSLMTTGAVCFTDLLLSVLTVFDKGNQVMPQNLVESHENVLFYVAQDDGAPVLSTMGPFSDGICGSYLSELGSNAYKKAFDGLSKEKLKAGFTSLKDKLKAVFANKTVKQAASVSSGLGTAGASIYSGVKGFENMQSLEPSVELSDLTPHHSEISNSLSIFSGTLTAAGSAYLSSPKISGTKFAKYISDSVSNKKENKENKKIPS